MPRRAECPFGTYSLLTFTALGHWVFLCQLQLMKICEVSVQAIEKEYQNPKEKAMRPIDQ